MLRETDLYRQSTEDFIKAYWPYSIIKFAGFDIHWIKIHGRV